jgi:DNA polymerase III gamma/tau subunit
VIGQDPVVKSLTKALESNHLPRAFLFTGPSGCGKTTLARILATRVGCDPRNLLEVDAATNSGIADMRSLLQSLQFQGMGSSSIKFVIVDEAHALSKATWQSLLLAIEEPADHVFWALCTTESDKVPKTIQTRCAKYELKNVPKDMLNEYLVWVAENEGLEVNEDVVWAVAEKAEGSVRQALTYLSAVDGCDTRKEALELMSQQEDLPEVIDMARKLVEGKGLSWKDLVSTVAGLQESGQTAESIRIVTVNYLAAVLLKTSDEKRAVRLLTLLQAFSTPYAQSEKMAPLLLSIGTILFQEQ